MCAGRWGEGGYGALCAGKVWKELLGPRVCGEGERIAPEADRADDEVAEEYLLFFLSYIFLWSDEDLLILSCSDEYRLVLVGIL